MKVITYELYFKFPPCSVCSMLSFE